MVHRVPEDLPCWIFFIFFLCMQDLHSCDKAFVIVWKSYHILFIDFFFFLFLHWYTYKRIFNCEYLNGWPKDFFFAPQNVFSDCSFCFIYIYIIYKNIYVCFCTNKTYYMYLYISKWYIYLNKFLRASYA